MEAAMTQSLVHMRDAVVVHTKEAAIVSVEAHSEKPMVTDLKATDGPGTG